MSGQHGSWALFVANRTCRRFRRHRRLQLLLCFLRLVTIFFCSSLLPSLLSLLV